MEKVLDKNEANIENYKRNYQGDYEMSTIYSQQLRDRAYSHVVEKGFAKNWQDSQQFIMAIGELSESIEAERKGSYAEKYTYPLLPEQKEINSLVYPSLTKEEIEAGIIPVPKAVTTYMPYTQDEIDSRFRLIYSAFCHNTVESEVADTYIRLLTILGRKNITPNFSDIFKHNECKQIEILLKKDHSEKCLFVVDIISSAYKIASYGNDQGLAYAIGKALFFLENIFMYSDDLLWHITEKMKYNEMRPHLHGKRF